VREQEADLHPGPTLTSTVRMSSCGPVRAANAAGLALVRLRGFDVPYPSAVAGQVGGDGESRVGGQEDCSAKSGRSAGPQDERGKSCRYCHGHEFDGPEAEGKRPEAPREKSYQ